MKAASLPYCESTVVLTGTLDRIGMSTTSGLHFCEIIIEPTRKKQRVHLPDAEFTQLLGHHLFKRVQITGQAKWSLVDLTPLGFDAMGFEVCEEQPPRKPDEVWLISRDPELWGSGEEYPTREAAIADLPRSFADTKATVLWVGQQADIDLTFEGFADPVKERLYLEACDQVNDLADDWPEVTAEATEELDTALADVIESWVRKYCKPTFYKVVEATEHRVEDLEGGAE